MEPRRAISDGDIGIAIQNFRQEGHLRLKIGVGDRVNILAENGDWYFGNLVTSKSVRGIFPKSYVRLKTSYLHGSSTINRRLEKQLNFGILTEIVLVLREWSLIWKKLYVRRDKNIMKIKDMMCDLISYHDIMLSRRLPKYHLIEMRNLVASLIDVGNKLLGLDMVVRNEEGNILPVKTTSAMRLFKEHEIASERVIRSIGNTNFLLVRDLKEDRKHHSNTLLVSFMNLVCITEDDLELVLTLYDAAAGCPISDNVVYLWKPNISREEAEKLQQMKALFTDLVQQDFMQKQIYLVCYAIRIGSVMQREAEYIKASEELDTDTNDQKISRKKLKAACKRRPFGIAAVDISSHLKVCVEDHEEDHIFLPLLRYSEGSMKLLLNQIIGLKEKAVEECVGQGLWLRIKFFNRDLREVISLNHLKIENTIQTQKIGLPEVIMPTHVHNELYLTIIGGEFYRFLSPEKNVEVAVCMCSEDGKIISGAIQMGNIYLKEYRSIIYYRTNKPEWYETLKINMPFTGFRGCHLKFTFTHRAASSSAEKPFALSFISIVNESGTLIQDGKHVLNLFMIDHRKFDEESCIYLSLPAKASDLETKKTLAKGLKLCEKDRLSIQTQACSTKITQNVNLIRLLNWNNSDHMLLGSLQAFLKVDGSEIITFLPDILDALFNILEEDLELSLYGVTVFDCLVHVLDVLSNEKYAYFLPVLNAYIEEVFSAPLAYKKLTAILLLQLNKCSLSTERMLKIMKSLHYYERFILRSRKLFNELQGGKDMDEFILSMKKLINTVMTFSCSTELDRKAQRNCLKYIYPLIYNIEVTLNSEELTTECCKQCCKLEAFIRSFDLLDSKDSIMIINEIVHSKIFLLPKCRVIIMPAMMKKLMEYLNCSIEMELCVSCFNGLLEPFQQFDFDDSTKQKPMWMLSLLEYVIEAIIRVERGSLMPGSLLALMIEIIRQMTPDSFEWYKDYFSTDVELIDFLMAMLIFFQELVSRPVFSSDWLEMIMLQNSVILKSLKCIATIMKDKFLEPFIDQIWNNYFHSAVAFVTQSSLQLENFSEKKCSQIFLYYTDMREEVACLVKDMWSSMDVLVLQFMQSLGLTLIILGTAPIALNSNGKYQRHFTHSLVGPFLEMALIPNAKLQEVIIPIFFEMAWREFYSAVSAEENSLQSVETLIHQKFNFYEIELEVASKFDILIEAGRGDECFKDQFCNILNAMFDQCEPMQKEGSRFMNGINEQLERLLECRFYIKEISSDNGVFCLYQLLDFYSKRDYEELYVRYVNKLCEWHLKNNNYAEAAETLYLHAKLLDWSCNVVSPTLRCPQYPMHKTCFELKEALYHDIIEYFDRGRIWHCAINFCHELTEVYENKVYNYHKLAGVLRQKSYLFDKIIDSSFPETEYFYVAFSECGFPPFLQNKKFVYRGNDVEDYHNFCRRIKSQFPKAHIIKELQEEDASRTFQQYIQIIKVFPVFDKTDKYSDLHIKEQILYHLREYNIQKFRFSASFKINTGSTLHDGQCINGTENIRHSFTSTENSSTVKNSRIVVETSQSFPWCLKMSPVTSISTNNISNIWSTIEEIYAINRSLYGILPVETSISQNISYVYLKLEEIVNNPVVQKLAKGMKVIMEENSGNLHLLKKLEGLLMEQMNLVYVFIQNFSSLDSLPKLLYYLKKCVKKLNIFCNLEIKSYSAMPTMANEGIGESGAPDQPFVKKLSSKRRKTKSPKYPNPLSFSRDSYELRNGNSLWYIPSPSSKLDAVSIVSQNSGNLKSSKSVFHVPTPISHLPCLSSPSSPLNKGFSFEISSDTSSGSSNSEVNNGIAIQKSQEAMDDLQMNVDSALKKNVESIPGKQSGTTYNGKIQLQTCDVVSDVPPPLPPKARDYTKSPSDAALLVDVKNEGTLKYKMNDYSNLPTNTD